MATQDTAYPPTGAIILAGGRATRMGGADKALQKLGSEPLVAHVIAALQPQCVSVVINANGPAARFAPFGIPVVPDNLPDFPGPLAGVLAGLDYFAAQRPDLAFAVSVATDTPFLPADLVARLHAARAAKKAEIAVARSDNIVHPTFALWPVGAPRRSARGARRRGSAPRQQFLRAPCLRLRGLGRDAL